MFSILSWNVEHFRGAARRVRRVVNHIQTQDPDIFALFEVEGTNVIDLMRNHFPDYDFNITDGPQTMETIVAHRRSAFEQVMFTQKREFKLYNPRLRPGALLTLRTNNRFYTVLFIHTDSGTEGRDFGNRYEMLDKIKKIKRNIDRNTPGGRGRLIVLGDLNTMGLSYPTRRSYHRRVTEEQEIAALDSIGSRYDMSLLYKEHDLTFNNLRITSDLDHVLASDNITFQQLGTRNGRNFFVNVRGWQQLSGTARRSFIEGISDHCSLYVEVRS